MKYTYCDLDRKTVSPDINALFPGWEGPGPWMLAWKPSRLDQKRLPQRRNQVL